MGLVLIKERRILFSKFALSKSQYLYNNIKYSYLREIREIRIFRGQVKVCDRQQSVVTASLIIKYSYLREIREIRIFRGQVKVCDRQQSVVTASLIIKYSYLREIRKIRIFRNHQNCLPVV